MTERALTTEAFLRESEKGIRVDLREENQVQFGTIPGAVSISGTQLQKLYELPKDKKIYLFCQKGELSQEILEVMLEAGYDAYHLQGGYVSYLRDSMVP